MRYGDFKYRKIDSGIRIDKYNGSSYRMTIPDTIDGLPVIEIGYKVFFECKSLNEIHLPDSLQTIGSEAFHWCISLKRIHFPDSVQTICKCAFIWCRSLKEIRLPESVQEIGENAFPFTTKIIYYTPNPRAQKPSDLAKNLLKRVRDLQRIPNISEEIVREIKKSAFVLEMNPANPTVENLVNEVVAEIELMLELQGKDNTPTSKLIALINDVSNVKISGDVAGMNEKIKNKVRALMTDYVL